MRSARLRDLASDAAGHLADAPAEDVVLWASETFGDRFVITASMGDTVLAHLASRVRAGVRVLFLDTGYHFAETIGTRDAVAASYDVEVQTIRPALSVADQDAAFGARLHDRDPDRCCAMRKVAPLDAALREQDAWASGIRRDEAPSRADTPTVAFDERRGLVKLAPLAAWTSEDVDAYAARHGLVVNPLVELGYASVGCAPCTRPATGHDPRSGRWAGTTKTECGIHV